MPALCTAITPIEQPETQRMWEKRENKQRKQVKSHKYEYNETTTHKQAYTKWNHQTLKDCSSNEKCEWEAFRRDPEPEPYANKPVNISNTYYFWTNPQHTDERTTQSNRIIWFAAILHTHWHTKIIIESVSVCVRLLTFVWNSWCLQLSINRCLHETCVCVQLINR